MVFAADAAPECAEDHGGRATQDTNHDITMKANFQVYRQPGTQREEGIYLSPHWFAGGQQDPRLCLLRRRRFTALRCCQSISRESAERQYVYTPATQRVRSVVPQERSARFIGTDFTFEDIGERVLGRFLAIG